MKAQKQKGLNETQPSSLTIDGEEIVAIWMNFMAVDGSNEMDFMCSSSNVEDPNTANSINQKGFMKVMFSLAQRRVSSVE